jgi:hypothetical protein
MLAVDERGERAVIGSKPTRMDAHSPGIDELSGLGPDSERDGAIVALYHQSDWSTGRLSRLFGMSERHVFRVLADFDAFREGLAR